MKSKVFTPLLTALLVLVMLAGTAYPPLQAEADPGSDKEQETKLTTKMTEPSKNSKSENKPKKTPPAPPLPTIDTAKQLREWAVRAMEESRNGAFGFAETAVVALTVADQAGAAAKTAAGAANIDYSGTNVQVQGVDEADTVKTDGRYIYQVRSGNIVIVDVRDPAEMNVVGKIVLDDGDAVHPQELYVDGDQLIVIAGRYLTFEPPIPLPIEEPIMEEAAQIQSAKTDTSVKVKFKSKPFIKNDDLIVIMPEQPQHYMTQAIVYDISDRANPKKVREVEVEGRYLTSRKAGSSLYVIANRNMDLYRIQQLSDDQIVSETPLYRDSASGMTKPEHVPLAAIRLFPDAYAANYMTIAALDLNEPDEPAAIDTYIGAGQDVYASAEHLYVAVTRYRDAEDKTADDNDQAVNKKVLQYTPLEVTTQVYKFQLEQGSTVYAGQGEVPGRLLNQFSMDEHEGYFRMATTTGEMWANDEHNISKNHIYILDESLQQVGKLENIAPGERIYSVRFMGDRGYMVTFRNVDPLFVIDLHDPAQPALLGALKIPGYSDYLHPYDENHIIGFGKDTIEADIKNGGEPVAFYLGMKVALFDVSDVRQPKEKFTAMIGDRGTDSELLHNHKALLFSKEKNVLAFPVTVHEVKGDRIDAYGFPSYGEFTFQGVYVYEVSPEKGFQLRGTLTHLSDENVKQAGRYGYRHELTITRALYINEHLYTLSPGMIRAYHLESLDKAGELRLP